MSGGTPRLDGPELPPQSGGKARQLIVFLHGLGADGNDLIGLADHWAALLPNAHFASPHAPEPCDMAPMGRQWFSLQRRDEAALLNGVSRLAPLLNEYLDARLAALGLSAQSLALVGFSQGTMTSLYVAYRRPMGVGAVLGYSGRIIGAERLAEEARAKPPTMLIHGDADEIVPVGAIFEAAQALGAADIPAQWHISEDLGHGIAPDGLEIGGKFLLDTVGRV
ncbi:MAG: phospholipase [Alphaproteobacteria bacterium]|nr:phospholipase [Alphaproteobacteria bacterium]